MAHSAKSNCNVNRVNQGGAMFWANINVFIACFILLAMFAAGPLFVVISIVLAPLGKVSRLPVQLMYPVAYFLLSLPLLFFWWKTNLAPALRNPSRERRYRVGHWLVGLTNVAAIAAFSGPFFLARISGNPDLVMFAWLALPVYALAPLVWIIGLFMIWSSSA